MGKFKKSREWFHLLGQMDHSWVFDGNIGNYTLALKSMELQLIHLFQFTTKKIKKVHLAHKQSETGHQTWNSHSQKSSM